MNAFDKVIGYKATKRELLQLCDMLRNREIYEEMGARLPHGLLLYGDPGLGKTLLARCFVEESGLHTITVRRDKGGDAFIDGITQAFARKTGIDMEDMVRVVLKQQYGAQEDMPRVSDEVIEKVALHEAGHLVVCEALCPGSVGFASLLPSDENRCGGFIHCCKGVSDSQSAIIALGGKAAVEMRYAGQVAEGCSDDIARAVNCIREAAAKEGTLGFSLLNVESDSSSNMSESLNARSEAAVQAELERYYGKARALLAQNEAFLKEITEALVMKKTLLYSDIQAIRGTAVKRNPAVTCEAASRYDAAEIENSPPEDPEEAMRQKIMRKLEEAERRRCS